MEIKNFSIADINPKKGFSRMGLFWFLVMIVLTFLILASSLLADRVYLQEGEVADRNVYYFGASTSYVSEIYTEQAQQMAAGEVEQIYKYDDKVVVGMQVQVDTLFDSLHKIRVSADTEEGKLAALGELLTPPVIGEDEAEPPDRTLLEYFLAVKDVDENYLRNSLKNAVSAAYGLGEFGEEALPEVIKQCESNIAATAKSGQAADFMLQAMQLLDFKPTHVFDQVATMDAVAAAIADVQPITVTVYPGQHLIERGAEVTAADVEALEAVGLQRQGSGLGAYLGLLMLVTICYGLLQLYCTRMSGDNNLGISNINMISLLFIIILLVARVITLIKFDTTLTTDWMLGLAIPVPAFAMLVAALVNKRTAIFATLIVSIFVGIMCGAHMLYIFAALVGGLVGVLQVSKMSSRAYYALAAVNISIAYVLVAVSWCLMWNYEREALMVGALMSLLNGIISVIMMVGMLPLLESMFSITTSIRLMELSNINHPLLKKMMIEAPGTYNHSILVGNLAEAAADQIGADGLLVRVAAYFHDIGKVKRPNFFVENQKPGENPHDKLQPSLSTFIITSHTKEGADIARSYKLPVEIIDIIEQHHGTGLVKGFYNKAVEAAKAADIETAPVREEDYRYPGPIPQTREAALVMLADSCQAAVQSMTNPTPGQIEGMVRDIVKGKLTEGQLDQCALTFRDLDMISSTFATILAGASHYRIPYPEQLAKELAKRQRQAEEARKNAEKNADKNAEKEAEKTAETAAEKPNKEAERKADNKNK